MKRLYDPSAASGVVALLLLSLMVLSPPPSWFSGGQKYSIVAAAAAIGGGAHQSEQTIPAGSPRVIELNQFTFYGAVSDGRLWFVEFYVPWCRGCKRVATTWAELADSLATAAPEVVIARFDCLLDEAMCERLDVHSTPTFKLYHLGEDIMTYRTEVYHIDLMRPFILKQRDKILLEEDTSAAAKAAGSGDRDKVDEVMQAAAI